MESMSSPIKWALHFMLRILNEKKKRGKQYFERYVSLFPVF